MSPEHPLSHSIPVTSLPADGRSVTLNATEEECADLARDFALIACNSLCASFRVSQAGGPLIAVQGRVEAEVVQECCVTLKPVTDKVQAEFSEIFTLDADQAAREIEIDVDDADPPEPVDGGEIDLGVLASEHLALNLDPYPRDPAAQFLDVIEDDGSDDEGGTESPFAALKALKTAKK